MLDCITLKRGRWRVKIKKGYQQLLLKLGLEDPNDLFEKEGARLLDDSERSNIFSLRVNGRRIVLKEYKPRGIRKAWTNLYRPSKAMREFVLGNKLLKMGIPVAEPWAVGEKRNLRRLNKCFLITEELYQAKNLSHYVNGLHLPLDKERIKKKRAFVRSLARSIREIHNKGFTHGDLNTSHIMVRGDRFYYLDFENARLKKWASDFRWVKDLSRLNESMPSYITRTDKLRFYKEYAQGNQAKENKKRRYLKRIERRTLKKTRNDTNPPKVTSRG